MRRAVVIVAFLAVGLCVPGAVGAAPDPGDQLAPDDQPSPEPVHQPSDAEDDETEANETEQNGIGQQVSSFVQSTAGNADGAVEQGMWEARVADNASDEDVAERADALENRLTELREERAALREARRNGTVSRLEFASRLAQLNGRLDALAEAANGTGTVADEKGLETADVDEIAAAAREARGPVDDAPGAGEENPATSTGPPDDTPGDDAPGRNDAGGESSDRNGGQDDTPGQGNASDGSSDRGNASDESSDRGNSPDDSPDQGNSPDQGDSPDDSPDQGDARDHSRGEGNTRQGPPK